MTHVYHRSPDSTSVQKSGGVLAPPEGWAEITAEEYTELLATHRPPQPVNMGGLLRPAPAVQADGEQAAPKTKTAARSKGK